MSLFLGSGVVTDGYPSGRERTLPWPAVGVDAPSIAGTSSDRYSMRVGLWWVSFRPRWRGEEPVSTFVAAPWPALGQRFSRRWPLLPNTYRSGSLLDLAGTACVIERADAVRASEHGWAYHSRVRVVALSECYSP